ncbi:MAG TPA: aspartate aminotransferase family protein [Rhizomicrobium sp.]|nr:aspartate aminotransferase family protein [Rhizomicrobium sp.]
MDKPISAESVLQHNRRYIPGGISSVNRSIDPAITFVRGQGAYLWDSEGKRYIDYHAGFAPYFLGHNFQPVNEAAAAALTGGDSLFGAGPSIAEGRLAELICEHVPHAEKITFLNTGSEATSLAVRIARAVTQRNHIIVMQGGYNGNHDELALNVFNTLAEIGPRVSPGEYPLRPLGAGTTITQTRFTHAVNYNDLESVRYVCRRYPIAALITEPLLQNIGVVKPRPGYLEGLRDLADEFGFLLVFDEVKTGFRHALGGYAELSGVKPDLVVYGKAVANGFPLAAVAGKRDYMDSIIDPDPARRPFVAGTYNGHPVAVAAAIETVRWLIANRDSLYPRMEALGAEMEAGIMDIFARRGIPACVARQGSAFSFYLMEKPPADLHDIIQGHDFARDVALRRALIQRGVFFVPIATKQCSLSAAHSDTDVRFTLDALESAVAAVW